MSQWNVLDFDEDGNLITSRKYYNNKYATPEERRYYEGQIMNGESYNYANNNGKEHERLDSTPPGKLDYQLRKDIKGSKGNENWKSPENETDYIWGEIDVKKSDYSERP